MKYLILPIGFLCFLSNCFSQNGNVSLLPPNPSASVAPDSNEVAAYARVKNNSPQTKTFFWHRTVIAQTPGWTSMVCDKNFCYPATVNVKQFSLNPGEEARLDIRIYPKGGEGKAAIDIKVTEVGNENNSATAHYNFNHAPLTTESDKAALKVFPNPAKDYFTISDNDMVHSIVIYNILGKPLKTLRVANGLHYDITDLPEGLYLIRMLKANGSTLKTVRLNKQREKA